MDFLSTGRGRCGCLDNSVRDVSQIVRELHPHDDPGGTRDAAAEERNEALAVAYLGDECVDEIPR